MFDHLYDAFGGWKDLNEGCFLFVDFSKAYDSVTHQFASTFFTSLSFPPQLVTLLLNLFKSPMALVINGGGLPFLFDVAYVWNQTRLPLVPHSFCHACLAYHQQVELGLPLYLCFTLC